MKTVPHDLSPDDSAQAQAFASQIHTFAEPFNKLVVLRYGQKLFKRQSPTVDEALDYTYILYHFPGVGDYIHPFITDDAHITAFENEVALRVYLLTLRRSRPVAAFEVKHEPS